MVFLHSYAVLSALIYYLKTGVVLRTVGLASLEKSKGEKL